jgi:hypothetical protein
LTPRIFRLFRNLSDLDHRFRQRTGKWKTGKWRIFYFPVFHFPVRFSILPEKTLAFISDSGYHPRRSQSANSKIH